MKSRVTRRLVLAGLGLLLISGPAAIGRAGDLNIIPMDEVPAAVKEAANSAAPNVNWLVAKGLDDEYALLGRETRGRERLVEFMATPDAKTSFVRVHIDPSEVAAIANRSLDDKVPGFQVESTQLTGLTMQKITAYRFIGKRADGTAGSVLVGLDGAKVYEE